MCSDSLRPRKEPCSDRVYTQHTGVSRAQRGHDVHDQLSRNDGTEGLLFTGHMGVKVPTQNVSGPQGFSLHLAGSIQAARPHFPHPKSVFQRTLLPTGCSPGVPDFTQSPQKFLSARQASFHSFLPRGSSKIPASQGL